MAQTHAQPNAFHGVDVPNYDVIVNCMHCGLCLPTCPTYALTGLERSSPRGRIRLIKAVADGDLPITQSFIDEMNFCLDCQACETACPAGVKYGSLVEAARVQIQEGGYESAFTSLIKRVFLRWFFLRQSRLKILARFMRFYQRSGLQTLVLRTKVLRLISRKLHDIQPLSPKISSHFSSDELAERILPKGPVLHRVAFLTGCLMDVAFADINTDTIELLKHHGCEILIPREQGCCGSLQAHNGDMHSARQMAVNNIKRFAGLDVEAIVMNSAGCGAFMKEYGHVFHDDPELAGVAAEISAKTLDITEFLDRVGYCPATSDRNPYAGKRVTYHDACHLAHTQKVTQEPRRLLRSIPGIDLVELPESTWCCGSAGIYNVVHYDDAMLLLDRKLTNVRSIAPQIIVTGNPGCLLQIQHGLNKEGMKIELLHTATFLRRACGI